MGWTGDYKTKGMSVDEYFADFWRGSQAKWLSKGYVVGFTEYYRPALLPDGAALAVVMLLSMGKEDRNGCNFYYKDMDETMGPFIYNAPKAMLDLLDKYPAPNNERAVEWRRLCRERLANRKSVHAGTVIKFAVPIEFVSGFTEDTFRFEKVPRGRRSVLRMFSVSRGVPVRVSKWRDREYVIVE